MSKEILISVVICTYNRCESLRDTLDSLLNQVCEEIFDYEVIVVDNNSKDKTKVVVESYITKFNGNSRYIFEGKQGLSHARNRGVKEARGEIIAFTDDDVVVDQRWLFNIARCFQDYNYDGIGGRILPLYSKNISSWIKNNKDLLKGPLVMYDYGEDIQIYNRGYMQPFVGANMAYKNECFSKGNLFRIDLGVGKGVLGEDTEFFMRLAEKNKRLFYCGKVLVWHKVDKRRMSLIYVARWNIATGRHLLLIDKKSIEEKLVKWFGVPRYLIRRIIEQVFLLTFRIFNQRAFLKTWISLFKDVGIAIQYREIWLKQTL